MTVYSRLLRQRSAVPPAREHRCQRCRLSPETIQGFALQPRAQPARTVDASCAPASASGHQTKLGAGEPSRAGSGRRTQGSAGSGMGNRQRTGRRWPWRQGAEQLTGHNKLGDRPAKPSHANARIERKKAMDCSALNTAATRTTTSGTAADTNASDTLGNLHRLYLRSLANLLSG